DKARAVLGHTGADAVMIGRAAQGRPWIFREIAHFLDTGEQLAPPDIAEFRQLLREHLLDHYAFHGEYTGVRTARKHVGWYLRAFHDAWPDAGLRDFLDGFNRIEDPERQLDAIDGHLDALEAEHPDMSRRAAPGDAANDRQFRWSHLA